MSGLQTGGGIPCRPNPAATLLAKFAVIQSVCSGYISSKTAERIQLKFCTGRKSVSDIASRTLVAAGGVENVVVDIVCLWQAAIILKAVDQRAF